MKLINCSLTQSIDRYDGLTRNEPIFFFLQYFHGENCVRYPCFCSLHTD